MTEAETTDPFSLYRFVTAQDSADSYEIALEELKAGHKTGHWIWFVFPQIAGLGRSPTSQHFSISGLGEARAYLAHPVLGQRLSECCAVLMGLEGRTADEIFGELDAMKLRSSMTLFAEAAPDAAIFREVLQKYFSGERDAKTLEILAPD